MIPVTPVVRTVAPAPEKESGGGATPPLSEDSDSSESYEAMQEDAAVSQGDVGSCCQSSMSIRDIYRLMLQV